MNFPHGETVIVRRGTPVVDPYSGEESGLSWTTPTDTPVAGCAVARSGTRESLLDGQAPVDADFEVYMPAGTDVTPRDRLVIRGYECEVRGVPFDWVNPFTGWAPGLAVYARLTDA